MSSAEHAVKAGADAIASVPSLFFKPYSIACVEDFLKAAAKEIPSLVGVKFSSQDLVDLHVPAPNRDDKKFNLMYGYDQTLMAGMIIGADGGVGSTYNFMPNVIRNILDNTAKGDITEARFHQYHTQQACKVICTYGELLGSNAASLKAIMSLIGVDLGPPRSPLRGPTAQEFEALRLDLQEIGFFDWIN